MRVISRKTLVLFANAHADARAPLFAWYHEADHAWWQSPSEIKNRYPSASILNDNRVIFNIKGNKYRLEVRIAYKTGIIYITHIETHAEYTKRHKKPGRKGKK